MKAGYGIVKAVPSADTIIVMGGGLNPPEKVLGLSGITVPRCGRGKDAVDEPFAFEAREFLRNKIIGRQVQFVVVSSNDSGREYADVTFEGVNVANLLVDNGWATVKASSGRMSPEREALLEMQQRAERHVLGIHRTKAGIKSEDFVRSLDYNSDVKAIFANFRNVPITAIVDSVRDGSSLRLELLGVDRKHPNVHPIVLMNLAGVQAPRNALPATSNVPERLRTAEPFAAEATSFTECRLLHRTVKVTIQGIDKLNNLYGTIDYKLGNISQALLSNGLSRFVQWSSSLLPDRESAALRDAEAYAKLRRIAMWKDWNPASDVDSSAAPTVDTGYRVAQVVTGDQVVLIDSHGVEKRFSLASIRTPYIGRDTEEPYAAEAKEYVRRTAIGKRARVIVEYSRSSSSADKAPVQCITLFIEQTNIALQLVKLGYAEVIAHRPEEPRSSHYDELLAAEATAKREEKGIHSSKKKVVTRLVDLTQARSAAAAANAAAKVDALEQKLSGDSKESGSKSKEDDAKPSSVATPTVSRTKQFLPFLQRAGQIEAIVENVYNGSRLKLIIPKENIIVIFNVSAIRCNPLKDADGKPDVWGTAALQFTRSRMLQHTVKIEVEGLDRSDTFVGNLFFGANNQNLAVSLLQEGYAQLFAPAAERNTHAKHLIAAERASKDARRGVFEDYVEPVVEAKVEEDRTDAAVSDGLVSVSITEVIDSASFFAHITPIGKDNAALTSINEKMAAFAANLPAQPADFHVKRGQILAGQFTDDKWYRVRVETIQKEAAEDKTTTLRFRVFFVDFGNYDLVEMQHLRSLPEDLVKLPGQARFCSLGSFIRHFPLLAHFFFSCTSWSTERGVPRACHSGFRRCCFRSHHDCQG